MTQKTYYFVTLSGMSGVMTHDENDALKYRSQPSWVEVTSEQFSRILTLASLDTRGQGYDTSRE